jgi:DsbC/DsbD-like thiol-disulfide interchange protein
MENARTALLAATFCVCLGGGAKAAATDWVEETGARIRLVAAEPSAGDTQIRAALEIELKDGWKTYWRDPGDAGVPPQISVTGRGISGFQLHYPAPERFDDGKSIWAGYKHMVAFPLTLKIAGDMAVFPVKASSFLGICDDICVPVQNEFVLDVPQASGSTADQTLVASYFNALPAAASETFKIGGLTMTGPDVKIDLVAAGEDAPYELFLAADGYMFGVPKLVSATGTSLQYSARIIFAPKNTSGADVFYTIKSANGAVSGTVPLTIGQ